MADLLTHVLVAYILAVLFSFRYDWITPSMVTVAMLGAVVPDLAKIGLVVPNARVKSLLGLPFDWWALHMLGGTLVAITIGALLTGPAYRRRVFLLLALGAVSHHVLDALLINPSGYSYALLWPLTTYHPPTPNLYLSSDRWPALASAIVAIVVWYFRWHRSGVRLLRDAKT